LQRAIARTYAASNVDAALAWAQGLSPPSPVLASEVLRTVAERDFERAAALVITEASAGRTLELSTIFSAVLGRIGSTRIRQFADVLAGLEDSAGAVDLAGHLYGWSYCFPEDALAWAVQYGGASELTAALGTRGNLDVAYSLLERVPETQRAMLVGASGLGHSFEDLPGSLRALERFRGTPLFDRAAMSVLSRAAVINPVFVAQFLDSASDSLVAQTAPNTARAWARRAPTDALEWASTLAEDDVRAGAVGGAIAEWAARNARAAGEWALMLPPGALRDHALATTIVNATANGLVYDRRLLAELSSDRARERVLNAAETLPTRWRQSQTAVARVAPAIVSESSALVGTLPWDFP
jgi:hypothetical protein